MKIADKDVQEGYRDVATLSVLNQEMAEGRNSWKRLTSCPACGGTSVGRFATIRHIEHYRCESCGFTFVNPLPPDDVLRVFYNSEFYLNYRRLEENRLSRDRYFSISMYTDMRRLAGWLGNDKSISVLDFGCGPGTFIAFLRDELGFTDVEGLELNRESIAIAKRNFGLDVVSCPEQLHHRSYDCVLLLEVIEHVPRPDVLFQHVADLVKPGGRVLITTPGVDNLVGRFLPSHCKHYTALSHVSLFTRRAISKLLDRFGFQIETFDVDEYTDGLREFFSGALYHLDYASPRNDDDVNDTLYMPNALGRLLGKEPTRNPDFQGLPLQRLGRFIDYVGAKGFGMPRNNHLYVLARKKPS